MLPIHAEVESISVLLDPQTHTPSLPRTATFGNNLCLIARVYTSSQRLCAALAPTLHLGHKSSYNDGSNAQGRPMQSTHWYEQPTDETTRICLRLDSLFGRLNQCMQDGTPHSCYCAITTLCQIMSAADRNDLLTKLQTLSSNQLKRLKELQNLSAVDAEKLDQFLQSMYADSSLLKRSKTAAGGQLRQNPFFNSIRQHINNPNGLSEFNAPQYSLWIRQTRTQRLACLEEWAQEFSALKRIVTRNLDLMRSNNKTQTVVSVRGLLQQTMDPTDPCQLVRVHLETDEAIYPTISVGKHQINIQLQLLDAQGVCQKYYGEDIPIRLQFCRS